MASWDIYMQGSHVTHVLSTARIGNVEILICMMYVCVAGVWKVIGSILVRDSLSHARDMLITSFHISSLSSKFTIYFFFLYHALGKVTKKLGQWIGKLGITVRIGLLQKKNYMYANRNSQDSEVGA